MMHYKREITPAVMAILASAVLLQCFTTPEARPTVEDGGSPSENAVSNSNDDSNAPDLNNSQSCATSSHVRNVCEMCAKVTKSRLAYPMCCAPNDQAGTRTWCLKFLNFGLTHHVWSFS